MKSNACVFKKGGDGLENILAEVEKVTAYNELSKTEALRLRLLAEELVGMLAELVKNFDGVFWLQNNENQYELHVELSVEGMKKEEKDAIIAVSASGKNAAAKGFMGKIREVAENMLLASDDPDVGLACYQAQYMYDCNDTKFYYSYAWTMDAYAAQYAATAEKDSKEEWDQLEKSVVANLADDVIVGVRGKKVDIVIKKKF